MGEYIKVKELKYTITEQMEPEVPVGGPGFDLEEAYSDVFVITFDHGRTYSLINWEDYKEIDKEIDSVMGDLDNGFTFEEVMQDYGLEYTPDNVNALGELYTHDLDAQEDRITKYMQIKTGNAWKHRTVRGYCQSDWAIAIYPAEIYSEKDIDILGDYCFGCFKEFSIKESGADYEVYGYTVTDSELDSCTDQAYKEAVCKMEGIDPEEAIINMIEDIKTIRQPVYRTA